VESSTAPYVILVLPLLLETGAYKDVVERILVVDCGESQQIARTMKRSRLSEEEVRRIMATQASRKERLQHADDVISNDGDMSALRAQVEALHRQYVAESQRR
jgi:dephospho-CoA kinase